MTNSTTSPDQSSAVLISEYQPGIVLMTMDLPDKGANILSDTMFAQLDQAISPLLDRDDIEGLILYSAKPKIFVAGADLVAINNNLDFTDEEIVKFCDDGRQIMAKFSQPAFPTVAAIHGACVGGGLELSLWCDRRIATDDRRTILGLPEAKLGLVPGWGGTVRVARIAESRGNDDPIAHQIDLVTSGRIVNASQAAKIGIVDEVTTQETDAHTSRRDAQVRLGNQKTHRPSRTGCPTTSTGSFRRKTDSTIQCRHWGEQGDLSIRADRCAGTHVALIQVTHERSL